MHMSKPEPAARQDLLSRIAVSRRTGSALRSCGRIADGWIGFWDVFPLNLTFLIWVSCWTQTQTLCWSHRRHQSFWSCPCCPAHARTKICCMVESLNSFTCWTPSYAFYKIQNNLLGNNSIYMKSWWCIHFSHPHPEPWRPSCVPLLLQPLHSHHHTRPAWLHPVGDGVCLWVWGIYVYTAWGLVGTYNPSSNCHNHPVDCLHAPWSCMIPGPVTAGSKWGITPGTSFPE